jgi:3-dehydroquinate synthase
METIQVKTKQKTYPIYLGGGLFKKYIHDICINFKNRKICFVMDSNLAKHYKKKLKTYCSKSKDIYFYTFPAGEKNKNRQQKAALEDFLLQNLFDRKSLLVAFGGGVTGDMTGFAASTFLRGISYIQIPTSVIAMVDSSVGGKTAIDTSYGKNLIGTFYQPEAVYIDTDLLHTLPEKEYHNGLGEVIKCACIAGKSLFTFLTKNQADVFERKKTAIHRYIKDCLKIKIRAVKIDEKETTGYRKILNFGHTIGHGAELLENYRLAHGEAVATGICYETCISMIKNLLSKKSFESIYTLLQRYNFPVKLPKKLTANKVYNAMKLDKKSLKGKVQMSLISDIGTVDTGTSNTYSRPVSETEVKKAFTLLQTR